MTHDNVSRADSGKASDGPYGVDQLERCGIRLTEVSTARTRIHRKIADVLHHRSGAPIDKAVRPAGRALAQDETTVVELWRERSWI